MGWNNIRRAGRRQKDEDDAKSVWSCKNSSCMMNGMMAFEMIVLYFLLSSVGIQGMSACMVVDRAGIRSYELEQAIWNV